MSGPLDFMLKVAEEAVGTEPLAMPDEEAVEPAPEEVAEQIDLSELSDEELAMLAAAAEEPDESEPEPEGEMVGEEVPEAMAEKLSAVHDFLGRVQFQGFWDEFKKTAKEEFPPPEEESEEKKGPGGHKPDRSGPPPHGMGQGPGGGRKDGSGMESEESEEKTAGAPLDSKKVVQKLAALLSQLQ